MNERFIRTSPRARPRCLVARLHAGMDLEDPGTRRGCGRPLPADAQELSAPKPRAGRYRPWNVAFPGPRSSSARSGREAAAARDRGSRARWTEAHWVCAPTDDNAARRDAGAREPNGCFTPAFHGRPPVDLALVDDPSIGCDDDWCPTRRASGRG
jgi:hypothetical protein